MNYKLFLLKIIKIMKKMKKKVRIKKEKNFYST